jgi:hypothetical protein
MTPDTPASEPSLFIVHDEPQRTSPALPARAITAYAFRARFTLPERVMLDLASLARPEHDAVQALQAATVRVMLQDMASAAWVDLDAVSVVEGLGLLQQAGLLTAERQQAILGAPVRADERPAVRA